MDSLTQAALGATVCVVTLRGKAPVWKSALWGAAIGTLPDLDVLIDFSDPIQSMTEHRGFSHALFFQALAAPILSLLIGRSVWWVLATLLALTTHTLLDAMTVYGTKLWLPFSPDAVGVGSIFIIDPLYTLWLLPWLGAAVMGRQSKVVPLASAGLALSTAYLFWSVAAQAWVTRQVSNQLPGASHSLLVTPSAFNTILWRLVAISDTHYFESWVSILESNPQLEWKQVERGASLLAQSQALLPVRRLTTFSDGFVSMRQDQGALIIQDLRMGQEPDYVFQFRLQPSESAPNQVSVSRVPVIRPPIGEGLQWIYERATLRTLLPFESWQSVR
ncbi:MAG: metal-dependent hydrolase [Burkholderiaceae bacterium]